MGLNGFHMEDLTDKAEENQVARRQSGRLKQTEHESIM